MRSAEDDAQIDRICDEFEEALSSSSEIRVMPYLKRVEDELQESLLIELCDLVLEIKGQNAVEEVARNFAEQYPDAAPRFEAVLKAITEQTTTEALDKSAIHQRQSMGEMDVIDTYRLIRKIGEGGMGTVWLAQQEQPVKRQVALKIIRDGAASDEVIVRFEAERQALAMMEHPNIARILDAGTTASGNPYFAMELVNGQILTDYCDNRLLTIEERLKIFQQICDGVQHAHQKGIIHRDLKPSNILITEYDGEPVPKIIDFGLAKALDTGQLLTDSSYVTAIGQVMGTFRYMSPEQAGLDAADIDTRSDIFALGVILYELLTGMTPLDSDSFRGKALLKILELIKEQESARPSIRLQSGGQESMAAAAASRKSDARRLRSVLSGDLDWIVMKAIERERRDRYQTAAALSDDLQRYVDDEPVTARPPSFRYRARKFLRKHRGPVFALGLILFAISLGLAGTIWFAIDSHNARLVADVEKQKAIAERDAGRQVLTYLVSSFRSSDPWVASIDVKVIDVLQGALQNIDSGMLKDNDRARAELLKAVGKSLQALGDYESGRSAYERALRIFETMEDFSPEDRIELQEGLAACLRNQGQFVEALRLEEQIAEESRRHYGDDSSDYLTAEAARVITLRQSGDVNASTELARVNLKRCRELLDSNANATLNAMNNLAVGLIEKGELEEAEELVVDLLERRKNKLSMQHPDTITSLNLLAAIRRESGHASEAVELSRQVLEGRISLLGEDHPQTLGAMNNLGLSLLKIGEKDEAALLLRRAGEAYSQKLGADHQTSIRIMTNAGAVARMAGQPDEAVKILKPVVVSAVATFGPNHPQTIDINGHYAQSLYEAGKINDGLDQYRQVVQRCHICEPDGGKLTKLHSTRLTRALTEQWLFEEALPILKQQADGPITGDNAQKKVDLAGAYLRTADFRKAEEAYNEIAVFMEDSDDLKRIKFAAIMYRAEALDQLDRKPEAAILAKRAREYFESIPEAQTTAAFARITEARCTPEMTVATRVELLDRSAQQMDSADYIPKELRAYYDELIREAQASLE